MIRVLSLPEDDDTTPFPPAAAALDYPNGLLAIGGPLSVPRLEMAYRSGIFPWFSTDQPVLWWHPDPRALLFPGEMHVSRSLRKRLRQGRYAVTLDRDFDAVIRSCAHIRARAEGTWITPAMIDAYGRLHEHGIGHSVEVWHDGRLAGGLYGVSLGAAFFGESMFSLATDASKVALAWLSAQLLKWNYELIDCQVHSSHLQTLGVREVPRSRFMELLRHSLRAADRRGDWRFDDDLDVERVIGG